MTLDPEIVAPLDGAVSDTAGAVVSRTVTLKLPVVVLDELSVALQFTAVVPSAKVDPEAGKQLTDRVPSTASEAVGVKLTAAPEGPVASAVVLSGSASTGPVVSRMMIWKVDEATFPWASVELQATFVVPSVKVLPETGEQEMPAVPSTRSEALGFV